MMNPSVLTIAPYGRKWCVVSGDQVLVLTRTKKAAKALAESAAGILRESGGETEVTVSREPRSFTEE